MNNIEDKIINTLISDIGLIKSEIETSKKINWIISNKLDNINDLLLINMSMNWRLSSANPLARCGMKAFSQSDEDGITLEIIRRLGLVNGTFAEFGVGNGLENNTLILANLGWKGFWIGGEVLAFDQLKASRLKYIKNWITLENINTLLHEGLKYLEVSSPNIVSLDLDGNDYHFIQSLLQNGLTPDLFICEYNAKFVPPLRFVMPYNPTHQWDGSDYYGAALMNLCELFEKFNYRLICCNTQTGANAFFIKDIHHNLFSDIPDNIFQIYEPPKFFLLKKFGHKISPKTIEEMLS